MAYTPFDNRLLKPQTTMINPKNGFKYLSLVAAFLFGIMLGGLIAVIILSSYNKQPLSIDALLGSKGIKDGADESNFDPSNILKTIEKDAFNLTEYVDEYFYPTLENFEEASEEFDNYDDYDSGIAIHDIEHQDEDENALHSGSLSVTPQIHEIKLGNFSNLLNPYKDAEIRAKRSPLFIMGDDPKNSPELASIGIKSNVRVKRTNSKKRDGVEDRARTPAPDNVGNSIYNGKRRRKRYQGSILLPRPQHITMYVEKETGKVSSIEHHDDYDVGFQIANIRGRRSVHKNKDQVRRTNSGRAISSKTKKRALKSVSRSASKPNQGKEKLKLKSEVKRNVAVKRGLKPRPILTHTKAHLPKKPAVKPKLRKREPSKTLKSARRVPGKGQKRKIKKSLLPKGVRPQRGAKARSLYGLAIDLSRKKHDHYYGFRSLLKNRYKYGYPKTMGPRKNGATTKVLITSASTKGPPGTTGSEIKGHPVTLQKTHSYGKSVVKAAGVVAGLAGVMAGLALGKEGITTREADYPNATQLVTSLNQSIPLLPTTLGVTDVMEGQTSHAHTSTMESITSLVSGIDSKGETITSGLYQPSISTSTITQTAKNTEMEEPSNFSSFNQYVIKTESIPLYYDNEGPSQISTEKIKVDLTSGTYIAWTQNYDISPTHDDSSGTNQASGTPQIKHETGSTAQQYDQTTSASVTISTLGFQETMGSENYVSTLPEIQTISSSLLSTTGRVIDITEQTQAAHSYEQSTSAPRLDYESVSLSSYSPLTGTYENNLAQSLQPTQFDVYNTQTFTSEEDRPSTQAQVITSSATHQSVTTYNQATYSTTQYGGYDYTNSDKNEVTIMTTSNAGYGTTTTSREEESTTRSTYGYYTADQQQSSRKYVSSTNDAVSETTTYYNYPDVSTTFQKESLQSLTSTPYQNLAYSTSTDYTHRPKDSMTTEDDKINSQATTRYIDDGTSTPYYLKTSEQMTQTYETSFAAPEATTNLFPQPSSSNSQTDAAFTAAVDMPSSTSDYNQIKSQTLSSLYPVTENLASLSTHISPDSTPLKPYDDTEHRKDDIPYYQTAEAYYVSSREGPRYTESTRNYDQGHYNYHSDLSFLDRRKGYNKHRNSQGNYNFNFDNNFNDISDTNVLGTSKSSESFSTSYNFYFESTSDSLAASSTVYPRTSTTTYYDENAYNEPSNVLQSTSPYLYYPGRDLGEAARENLDPEVFYKLSNNVKRKKNVLNGKDSSTINVNYYGRNIKSSNLAAQDKLHPGLLSAPQNDEMEVEYSDFSIDPEEFDEEQRRDIKALSNIDIPEYLEVTTTKSEMLEIQRCHCKSFNPEDTGVYYQCRYDPTRSKRTLMAMDCHLSELPADILFPKDCSNNKA